MVSFFMLYTACGKKTPSDGNNGQTPSTDPPCNLPSNTIIINSIPSVVNSDTSFVSSNGTFFILGSVNSWNGCSIEFKGSAKPAVGKYTITASYNEMLSDSGKVYVQCYINGNALLTKEGKVDVLTTGSSMEVQFCDRYFSNSLDDTATVSFRAYIR